MNDLTDFLFGKKVLKKAAGETEAPKPTTQSTDYVSEQIKKSRRSEPSMEHDFNPERLKDTPAKKPVKPMAPSALDKLKKPQPKY